MAFTQGLEKTAAVRSVKSVIKATGKHLSRNRRDYLLGTAAVGSVGTAVGSNRGKK